MAPHSNDSADNSFTPIPKVKPGSLSTKPMVDCRVAVAEGSDKDIKYVASHFEWRADVDLLAFKDSSELTADLPTSSQQTYATMLEQTAFYYMKWSLSKLSSDDLETMEPHFKRLHARMQKFVKDVEDEKLDCQTGSWLMADGAEKATLRHRMRDSGPEGYLMCLMGRNIPFILKKEVNPTDLLTGDQSLKAYLKGAPRLIRTYDATTKYLVLLSQTNPELSILEIGAGTAGATLPILKSLSEADAPTPHFHSYDFTDVDGVLLDASKQKISTWKRAAGWHDRVTFKTLDIESDPVTQEFSEGSYDVIVASYTLHSKKSLHAALVNARRLLKRGGKLVIIDVTRERMASTLLFGTLAEWWAAEEDHRQESPVLKESAWDSKLLAAGFSGLEGFVHDSPSELDHQGSMMVSSAL